MLQNNGKHKARQQSTCGYISQGFCSVYFHIVLEKCLVAGGKRRCFVLKPIWLSAHGIRKLKTEIKADYMNSSSSSSSCL
jgi:hypothetical protein